MVRSLRNGPPTDCNMGRARDKGHELSTPCLGSKGLAGEHAHHPLIVSPVVKYPYEEAQPGGVSQRPYAGSNDFEARVAKSVAELVT